MLVMLSKFLEDLLENEIWFVVLRRGRQPHRVSSSLGSVSPGNFLQGTGQLLQGPKGGKCPGSYDTTSCLVHRDDRLSFPIFRFPSRSSGPLTHTSYPRNSISVQGFPDFRPDIKTACILLSFQC